MEESPVRESRSNGSIENAVQLVQGMIRTLRDALESRYGERLEGHNMMIPWMVMHAAATMSRFSGKRRQNTSTEDKGQDAQYTTDRTRGTYNVFET